MLCMANTNETYAARIQRKLMKKQYLVEVATGRRKADLVLKNASYVNVFSNELCHGDIAVAKGQIVGMGDYAGEVEYDVSGKIVCPGFIDAHHPSGILARFAPRVCPRRFAARDHDGHHRSA